MIETIGRGGGAEQLVVDLAPRLRALGLEVEIAALFEWPDDLGDDLARAGVPLHRLHIPSRGAFPRGLLALRRVVHGKRFDLFWSHLASDHLYARAAAAMAPGSVTVNTFHGELPDPPPASLRSRASRWLQHRACASSAAHVAVSKATESDFARVYGWRDIRVAHNGVDLSRVEALGSATSPAAARAAFGVAENAFLLVVPARYVQKKGQAYLIDAVARLRDAGVAARVLMFGTGPTKAALQAQVEQLKLDDAITVAGIIPHDQLFPLIRAANAVVQPSLREPFGIGAVEAMALGTPVILSDVDGFRETTDAGRVARMVPPGDAAALAAAIHEVHADPASARARADAARAHVFAHFSIDACAARWHAILTDALGERG